MSKFIHSTYSLWLLILGPLVFVFALGPWIDRKFPVVDPFVVVVSQERGGYLHLEGWLEKHRDCKTLEVYSVAYHANGIARIADIAFLDRSKPELVSRPTGVQFWGPWEVVLPRDADRVVLRTTHRCHALWDTTSEKLLWEREK